MKVEVYEAGGKNARVVDATRVLVRSDKGTPLVLAVEWDGGHMVAHVDDPDFDTLLQTFGADRVVVRARVEFDNGRRVADG